MCQQFLCLLRCFKKYILFKKKKKKGGHSSYKTGCSLSLVSGTNITLTLRFKVSIQQKSCIYTYL